MEAIIILAISFCILMFLGVPVAFSLGVPCVIWLLLNPQFAFTALAQNTMSYMLSFTLISMPAFLFVGRMLNTCGVTDRLFKFAIAITGRWRGGLAHANALASMLFASMSGTAVGDAGGLGLVEMKMMKDAGYAEDVAAGVTAASSILGPIIPPSSCMVMLGSIVEVSVASLFYGGILPGIIMAAALMVQIALRAKFTKTGKTWPKTPIPWKQALKTIPGAIPALMTFVIILGSINGGICTPTEAAVLAIWWSIILGICYKKLTWKNLWKTLKDTIDTCGVFMPIVAIASFFSWVLTVEGLPFVLKGLFGGLIANGEIVVLLVCALIFLILGCFLDTSAAVLLIAPVLFPVVTSLGVDAVQFGIIMVVGLMIGIITPPFGICLFVVSDVNNIPVKKVTKEAVKYIPAMVITLLLIIFIPKLVTWLPQIFLGYVPS